MTRHPVMRLRRTRDTWKLAFAATGAGAILLLSACAASAPAPARDAGAAPAPQQQDPATGLSVRDLIPLLTRYGVGPREIGLDVTYASQLFFDITGMERPEAFETRPTLAFIISETIHEGDLTLLEPDPPAAYLVLDDGSRLAPYEAAVLTEDPHHRTSRALFDVPAGWPTAPGDEGPLTLRLVVPLEDDSVSVANTFEWQLPIHAAAAAEPSEGG